MLETDARNRFAGKSDPTFINTTARYGHLRIPLKISFLIEKSIVREANGIHTALFQLMQNLQKRDDISLAVNTVELASSIAGGKRIRALDRIAPPVEVSPRYRHRTDNGGSNLQKD